MLKYHPVIVTEWLADVVGKLCVNHFMQQQNLRHALVAAKSFLDQNQLLVRQIYGVAIIAKIALVFLTQRKAYLYRWVDTAIKEPTIKQL
jgi:hypothetical protein